MTKKMAIKDKKKGNNGASLRQELEACRQPDKAIFVSRFFKSGPGQYGEGDIFWGIAAPQMQAIAKRHINDSLEDIESALADPVHEVRAAALFAMAEKYQAANEQVKAAIVRCYLANTKYINNWDLVDLSCYRILGDYLWQHQEKREKILSKLAKSKSLWERRIAIVLTIAFIRQGSLDWTFRLAEMFIPETHDLMHKATGWLLREAGKRDVGRLKKFLDEFGARLPRTALRYAIERLPEKEKRHYLLSTKKKV